MSRKETHETAAYHLKRCIAVLEKGKIDQDIIQLLQQYLNNWELE